MPKLQTIHWRGRKTSRAAGICAPCANAIFTCVSLKYAPLPNSGVKPNRGLDEAMNRGDSSTVPWKYRSSFHYER